MIDSTTGAMLTDGPVDGPPEVDGGVTGVGLLDDPPQAKKNDADRVTAATPTANRDGLFNFILNGLTTAVSGQVPQ